MRKLLPLLFAFLLLAGCVDYDEELWLNPDGSGRAKLKLVNKSYYDQFSDEFRNKEGLPGIHLISSQTSKVGSNWIYQVEFKFDSIEAFNNVNDRISTYDFWGGITLNQTEDRKIIFKRRIALGHQTQGEAIQAPDLTDPDDPYSVEDTLDILENFFKKHDDNRIWSYKLHVPWQIISTNALSNNVNKTDRTLFWKFETQSMWNNYREMTVEMKKGISWLVFVLAGLAVLLLSVFIIWMFRIYQRSHLHDVIAHKKEHEQKRENQ